MSASGSTDVPGHPRLRRDYLDWLRGVAVLLMIVAHLFDSWTREPDRSTGAYRLVMIVGGMGTVLFLLLAGVAVGLSAGSKWRRTGDRRAAASAVARRGLEIFALAFLFRFQAWFLGWSSNPRDLLKVDVLNIMGPSIVFAALLWRMASGLRARAAIFGAATLATAFLTPAIRQASLGFLADPLEAYLVPVSGLSGFAFFPWLALVFAGALLGVLIDASRPGAPEQRLMISLAATGAILAVGAYGASYLPPVVGPSEFWSSSPAYLLLRVGAATLGIAAVYGWNRAFVRPGQWSPLVQLGRTSLFIYWIHVELVYGLISLPLQRALSFWQACVGYVLFTAFMLLCSVVKDQVVERFRLRTAKTAAV